MVEGVFGVSLSDVSNQGEYGASGGGFDQKYLRSSLFSRDITR